MQLKINVNEVTYERLIELGLEAHRHPHQHAAWLLEQVVSELYCPPLPHDRSTHVALTRQEKG